MPTVHLTKRNIEALPLAATGQVIYRDTEMRGLGLRVGSQSKVFIVEGQVAKRTVRVTLGRYGPLTPDQARKLAQRTLGEMVQGANPNARKRIIDPGSVTLRRAFSRFFEAKPTLSQATRGNYWRTVDLYLADWADRPIVEVTRTMVLHRHQKLSAERGAMTANTVMRHLRSVYNFLASTTENLPPNPVAILSQARVWAPERRRQGVLPPHVLPAWYEAVVMQEPLARDFLLIAILTGMRRREVAALRWEYIDFARLTLTVPKTKNGDPLVLPLSSYLARLLTERKQRTGNSPWVFPTRSGRGHLQECKGFVRRVGEQCGHEFTVHDLRRTFITIAEAIGTPAYALKRLLNHRVTGDVTAGYIVMDVERLREPVDRIAERVLDIACRATRLEAGSS